MKQPIFRKESEIQQIRISRPGSDGYALFRMVIDPQSGDSASAVLCIHEHPPGLEPIPPHFHQEVEETVYSSMTTRIPNAPLLKNDRDSSAEGIGGRSPGDLHFLKIDVYLL